jgi:serine/threonine-protein kinase
MRRDSSSDVAAPESEGDDPSITAVADEPAVTRERAPEVQPGDLLAGRYQVEAIIGKGGSGVVLRAFDRVSATVVAVKVLKPGLTHDPRWEKRFQRELRLGRPIRHPNVCRIFDIDDADGYRFLTMEFATGGTLRDLVKKNAPLRSLQERLTDAAGVIAGLAAIHSAGIVHRDVKPDNMLRMEDGRLVLSDFGLATDLPDSTMVSVFVGTPHYMAPEVREGDPATTRSDVWSLGVVLHEILVGRRPERRNSRSGASTSRTSSSKTSSIVERAMLALCERCLVDDPGERPADANEVERLFKNAYRAPSAMLRSTRRRFMSFAVIAAAAVVAVVVGAATAYRRVSASAQVRKHEIPRLILTGEPADWSNVAKTMAAIPGHVHCFSVIDGRTARLIWGRPRRAEDIDVATGERQPSRLAPETYASGCPELSLDGASLLFVAEAHEGASEVRLSDSPSGVPSKSITPGAEPIWLGNGREFLYDIDPSHAAVFSLPTMSFVLLPDSGLGGHQMIAAKTTSRKGNLVALLLVDDKSEWAIAVHEGAGFDLSRTLAAFSGQHLHFDEWDRLVIADNQSPLRSTLLSVDWRGKSARRLGTIPGLEIVSAARALTSTVVLARRFSSDVWLQSGRSKRRLTTDGRNYAAAISSGGDLLLSKRANDGTFVLWRQSKDGAVRQVTRGPNDTSPDFSPDGTRWAYVDYLNKSIMICAGEEACRVLKKDELLPTWPRFSPDGNRLAYVTQVGTPRLIVVTLGDGREEQIGPMRWQCPPVWSSPTTIWSLEGTGRLQYWVERQAVGGALTGQRIVLGATDDTCWPAVSQPESPFFSHVEVGTNESTQLRRLDL